MKQYADTGKVVRSSRKRDNHFSEEMRSDAAVRYQAAIRNLSNTSWDLIVDGAWGISQEIKGNRATSSCIDAKMPEVDERELLAEGDEVVEDDGILWDECEYYYPYLQTPWQ